MKEVYGNITLVLSKKSGLWLLSCTNCGVVWCDLDGMTTDNEIHELKEVGYTTTSNYIYYLFDPTRGLEESRDDSDEDDSDYEFDHFECSNCRKHSESHDVHEADREAVKENRGLKKLREAMF